MVDNTRCTEKNAGITGTFYLGMETCKGIFGNNLFMNLNCSFTHLLGNCAISSPAIGPPVLPINLGNSWSNSHRHCEQNEQLKDKVLVELQKSIFFFTFLGLNCLL
jgi:hypothetical protein